MGPLPPHANARDRVAALQAPAAGLFGPGRGPEEARPLAEGSTVKLYDAGLIMLVAAVAAAIALIAASQVGG